MKNISSPTLHCFLTITRFLMALFFSLCFVKQATLFGQQTRCNTFTYEETLLQDAEYAQRKVQVEAAILESAKNKYHIKSMNSGPYTIPVAIHVVHATGDAYGEASNIHDSDIFDAIQFLNQSFSTALDPLTNQYEQMDISFCLAGKTRNGSNTYTDLYRPDEDDPGNPNASIKSHFGTISAFPRTDFMNVWVVRSICQGPNNCSLTGYSTLAPAHGSWYDGIVIEYAHLGNMVFVHEVGHYLNLIHTFGNSDEFADCTNNDCLLDNDKVCDTRPDGSLHTCSETNHCHTDTDSGPFTTDENDPVGNIMDYGNLTCEEYFTVGQRDRMYAAIEGVRSSLLQNTGGCCPAGTMSASFSYSLNLNGPNITLDASESDPGSGSILNYSWDFGGGLIETSTSPQLTDYPLPAGNVFKICLTITGDAPNCSDTECTQVCIGSGDGCNYLCNKDFESPLNTFGNSPFATGDIPNWDCVTGSPSYSPEGLSGTSQNSGSAYLFRTYVNYNNNTEAVRGLTGELPDQRVYLISMYKKHAFSGTLECVPYLKTKVFLDKDNNGDGVADDISGLCHSTGGQFHLNYTNAKNIFEDTGYPSNADFNRFVSTFILDNGEVGFMDVVIVPWEYDEDFACAGIMGPALFVTRVELVEDHFSAGEDQTLTCPGEVTLGGLDCTLSDVKYTWTNLNTGEVVWQGPSPQFTTFVEETTSFKLNREFGSADGQYPVNDYCVGSIIYNDVVHITVENPKPNPAFTYSLDYCTNTVTFNSYDQDGLHSWVFHDPANPGTAQSANPVFTFSDLGDFLVTHTVSNTCGTWTYTTMVTVACVHCDCPPGIYIESMGLIDLLPPNSYVLPPTPTAPVNLYINTELVIDMPVPYLDFSYTFPPGSTICMGENAKITINNGSGLKFDGSVVKGCDKLWEAIQVEAGGKLEIANYSTIQDGLFAVHLEPGSRFLARNSTFDKNFISVNIMPVGDPVATFIGNTFDGTGLLLPTSYMPPTGSAFPVPGMKPWAGIYSLHDFLLSIGKSNTFKNLSNGIISDGQGSLIVTRSSFANILENPEYNFSGFGIHASPPLWGSRLIVTGFGNDPLNDPPSFKNCNVGVHGENISMSINDNIMQGMQKKGVQGLMISSMGFSLKDNAIQSEGTAISLIDALGTYLHVWNNTLDIGTDGTGIRLENVSDAFPSPWLPNISKNVINMQGGTLNGGIFVQNTSGLRVRQNDISLGQSASKLFGIRIDNSHGNAFTCNTVTGSGQQGNSSKGFMISSSQTNYYTCNSNTANGIGVQFNNICDATNFRGNQFLQNATGLQYSNMGMTQTGPQNWRGNTWDNSPIGVEFQMGGQGSPQFSPYRIQVPFSPASDLWPVNAPDYSDWFIPNPPPTNDLIFECPTDLNTCDIDDNFTGPGPCEESEFLMYVANGLADTSYSGGIKWMAERYLFRRLGEDCNDAAGSNTTFSSFYNNHLNTTVGKFQTIAKGREALFELDASKRQIFADYDFELSNFIDSISIVDDSLEVANENEISGLLYQKEAYLQNLGMEGASIFALASDIQDQQITMAAQLKSDNNEIAVGDIFEVNEKTVNQVYLNTFAVGVGDFSPAQIVQLQSIAEQCPVSGGNAVYMARAMLDVNHPHSYDDHVICANIRERAGSNELGRDTKGYFLVYPNPANNELNLSFTPSKSQAVLTLTDIFGRQVANIRIAGGVSTFSVPTVSMNSGVYFLMLRFDDNSVLSKTVLISR